MEAPTTAREAVFTPLRVEGAVEGIVRRLGEAIGSGLLRPGERLPSELELAELLAVAPMTLRQALAVLRDAGYVETRRGRGAGTFVVADLTRPLASTGRLPSTSALRDLVDWRRAVGGETAALAARRADEPGRRAILEAAAAVEVATRGDFSSYRLADAGFHVAVAEVTGSGRLIAAETAIQAELGEILAALPGTWSAQALQASTAGHAPIETAIVRADPVAARDAMLAHVESTFDWIVGLHLGRLAPDA